jgi:hypothetical protein
MHEAPKGSPKDSHVGDGMSHRILCVHFFATAGALALRAAPLC